MATTDTEPLILQQLLEKELLKDVPSDINDFVLKLWNKGVFSLEVVDLHITPPTVAITDVEVSDEIQVPDGQVESGT